MIITLCSSTTFYPQLRTLEERLISYGHSVLLPSMVDYHSLEETALAKIQNGLIRDHFKKIEQSDAILVANYQKKGIEGYIGGNTFLEMGKAFDCRIPIYLVCPIPREIGYREEILAMEPIVVGEDLRLLKR